MSIMFEIGVSYSHFYPDTQETRDVIDNITSFQPNGYYYSPKYKKYEHLQKLGELPPRDVWWYEEIWDGWYKFRRKNRIPTGILFLKIIPYFKQYDISYDIKLLYKNILVKDESYILDDVELRDYQIKTIKDAISARRAVIQLPTNAGKTALACSIIKSFGEKFVFITHRAVLFHQTHKEFIKKLNIDAGLIGDELCEYKDVGNIVMIQTLQKQPYEKQKKLLNVPVMIIDEVHHYTGPTKWYDILIKSNAVVRMGLSATPLKNDEINDWKLLALTGVVIGDVTNRFLIDEGYSTEPEIHIIRTDDTDIFCNVDNKSYQSHYKVLMNSFQRNNQICQLVDNNAGKQILILVDRIFHGILLNKLIPNSIFLSGADRNREKRKQIIDDFSNRKINVLITTLLDEGVDIASIEVLIFANPMRSTIKVLQRIGRGMRKDVNKEKVLIYDFNDEWSDYFRRQAKARQKIYRQEKFKIVKKTL